jgi:hypothetical protein
MFYYVNDATRMVRTSDTAIEFPGWRAVSLADWNAFRLETKALKGKRK